MVFWFSRLFWDPCKLFKNVSVVPMISGCQGYKGNIN